MKTNWLKLLVAAVTISSAASAAFAQYVWLDEKGTKQYSDMPPPSSVPKANILKAPGKSQNTGSPDAGADTAGGTPGGAYGAAGATKSGAPMTTAEKNTEFNKRKAEQAEKDKKDADKARLAEEKTKNCERTRAYSRALESGERIASTDKGGERYFLTDEQRAKEVQENKRALEDCK